MNQEYTIELASQFIGKKILISLKNISSNGEELYEAFYGVIESVHEDGYKLKLQGSRIGEEWFIPPDLDAFEEPEHKFYELDGSDDIVEGIEYVTYWNGADCAEDL